MAFYLFSCSNWRSVKLLLRAWQATKGWVERNPLKSLILLGVITEAIYLFVFTLPFLLPDPEHYGWLADIIKLSENLVSSGIVFVVAIITLFAIYYLGWRLCRKLTRARVTLTIFIFASLFGITLIFMYPITAIDMFNYFFYGRIFIYHDANPLVAAPFQFSHDPLSWTCSFGWTPAPYGPLWILLSAVPNLLGGDSLLLNLILLKVEMVIFYLLSALLIYRILTRVKPQYRNAGLFLFAWSPLILYEGIGNGHNDMAMIFLILLGIYAIVRGRPSLGFAALIGSVFIKYTSVLIIPFFLLFLVRQVPGTKQRAFFLGKSTLIAAAIGLALYAPFWSPGEIMHVVLDQTNRFIGSVPAMLKIGLETELGLGYSTTLVKWLVLGVFGAFYLRRIFKMGSTLEDTLSTSFEVLFFFLLLASTVLYPWYLIWPLALMPLITRNMAAQRMTVFSLTALLAYFIWFFVWVWIREGNWFNWGPLEQQDFPSFYLRMCLLAVPFTVIPPLLLSIWAWRSRRRCKEPGSTGP
jgi:hypothetical protein